MAEITKDKFLDMLWRTKAPGSQISFTISGVTEYQRFRYWVQVFNNKYAPSEFKFQSHGSTVTVTRIRSNLGELDGPVGWTRNPDFDKSKEAPEPKS